MASAFAAVAKNPPLVAIPRAFEISKRLFSFLYCEFIAATGVTQLV
jgi:hypothetical protein